MYTSHWDTLKNKERQVRSILLSQSYFSLLGAAYITNVLRSLDVDPASTTENTGCLAEERLPALLAALQAEAVRIAAAVAAPSGFILRLDEEAKVLEGGTRVEPFVDYSPFPLRPGAGEVVVEFASLHAAMDAFYTNEENRKLVQAAQKWG